MTPKGCDELLPTAKWHIFLTTVSGVLLSVMICSTNALILLGIYRNTSLQCVTNYFLAVLAFSDFFVGFVAIPIWVVRSLAGVSRSPTWKFVVSIKLLAIRAAEQ
ncbi:uncharacterized protein LOC141873979 [Acropora palmata]|uniref:uncharacterized protein LOC141873979 n=1 Tax=Acropora palmata TaxID=6131 RepID=UPI003DA0B25C